MDYGCDRKAVLRQGIDVSGKVGLEIGALMNPIVTKAEGMIYYADHLDTKSLIHKYANDPNVDTGKIVQVDYVWGDQTLGQAVPRHIQFDYIIASHVIEHVPDMIGWLFELDEVLKEDGIVSLAIPDKRYTFDYFRPLTTMAELIDAYLNRYREPTIRQLYDSYANTARVDTYRTWLPDFDASGIERYHTEEEAFQLCKEISRIGGYHDVHCTIFTVHSFLEIVTKLIKLGLFPFTIVQLHMPVPYSNEFIVKLGAMPKSMSPEERMREQLASLPSI
ncbi:methyltransferase domain-containing protein [Paenibacillus kobensis]|uniref:methyltransferase domain-containing protein n=1 Tax=Paenibacillus kobensis TaxID=59841 RepID=UPI000FD8AF3B|nr:methyltransferase domain-containing protein [Paenibacillus kobensis]